MDIKKASEQRHAGSVGAAVSQTQYQQRRGGSTVVVVVSAIVVIALLGLVAWLLFMKNTGTAVVVSTALNKDEYQSVFLSNGQVYFGKLQNTDGDSLVLKDIYYLQVDSAIQPSSGDESAVSTKTESSDSSNVQLIKLGNELHGPEDQMQITKSQVLFWENLKKDGKVTKAIDSYTKK